MITINYSKLYKKHKDSVFNTYIFLLAYPALVFNIAFALTLVDENLSVFSAILIKAIENPTQPYPISVWTPIFISWFMLLIWNVCRQVLFNINPKITIEEETKIFLNLRQKGCATNELIQQLRSRDIIYDKIKE